MSEMGRPDFEEYRIFLTFTIKAIPSVSQTSIPQEVRMDVLNVVTDKIMKFPSLIRHEYWEEIGRIEHSVTVQTMDCVSLEWKHMSGQYSIVLTGMIDDTLDIEDVLQEGLDQVKEYMETKFTSSYEMHLDFANVTEKEKKTIHYTFDLDNLRVEFV